jgi:hypothetical protein
MTDYKARAKQVAIKRSKQFAKNNKGTAELRRFISEFEKFPPDLRKEMRPMLRKSGEQAMLRARSNFSWSSRIPKAIKVSVTFSKRTAGIRLTGNKRIAPHMRAYENLGRHGFFRAPTGTPPEPWVRHRSRPGFFRAADVALAKDLDRKIGEIVDTTARKHGFR